MTRVDDVRHGATAGQIVHGLVEALQDGALMAKRVGGALDGLIRIVPGIQVREG